MLNKYKLIIGIIIVSFVVIAYLFFFTEIIVHDGFAFKDIKNYRLGDAVQKNDIRDVKIIYDIFYRNTIAVEYMNSTPKPKDYEVLYKIVKRRTTEKLTPPPETLIFHLRTGDVLEKICKDPIDSILNNETQNHYLVNYDFVSAKISNFPGKKVIIISGYHTKGNRSRSEEYISKIKKYIESLGYDVEVSLDKRTADEDFIYMSNSKYFLQSGGGFSDITGKMVELNGGNSI